MGEWDAPHLENQDPQIMPYIHLCNVACGAHAGSRAIMKQTIELAMENDVRVGAHPGYADKHNFGRAYIELSEQKLKDLLRSQMDLFLDTADTLDAKPYHIKPHGALYHACNHSEMEMNVLIDIMKNEYPNLVLLVFPDSMLHKVGVSEHLNLMAESFIDRLYTDELKLVSRSKRRAVITDEDTAKDQYDTLVLSKITTQSGSTKKLISQTACIHGDNPNVLSILKSIHHG